MNEDDLAIFQKRADGSTGVDLTRDEQLDETTIQDIGYLRCGVTEEEIYKLTAKAIDENIEEMQTCPFKVQQAKALAKRAIHYKK